MIPTAAEIAYLQGLEPAPSHWGGTGALRRRPDSRDYPALLHPGFRAVFEAEAAVDTDYANMVCSQTNQGATGACVIHSTCYGIQVNENITQKVCYRFNPQQLYTELGGTGANGIDSRVALQRCKDVGAPLANSDKRLKVGSYYWIDPNQATFVDQVKTALTAGKSVVLALLLPSTFSGRWTPGNPTTGYHQLDIVGTKGDLFWGPNSWGENWGGGNHPPGFYELSFNYCMADGFQHSYCYAYFFDSVPLDGTPPPPPPPPPPPTRIMIATGRVTGAGAIQSGQTLTLGPVNQIVLTDVHSEEVPPPSPLSVTGYSSNPVKSGQPFTIDGTGFQDGNLSVSWQGVTLAAQRLSDTQIQATAPTVTTPQSRTVTVRVEGATANGPLLMVTADDQPPPGGLTLKLFPRRRSATTVTLLAYCYSASGSPETATLTGSVGNVILDTRQAQIGSWTVTGLPQGQQQITVNATSANGSGTAAAVI